MSVSSILDSLAADLDVNLSMLGGINDIDEMIIKSILLADLENPDWVILAGRLYMYKVYDQVAKYRGSNPYSLPLYDIIQENIESGVYTPELLRNYTRSEIEELERVIDPNRDMIYDYAGAVSLVNRYLARRGDQIVELPQEMFMVISMLLAKNEDNKLEAAKQYYHLLSNRKLSLSTPILLNLRRPGSNLASCFIVAMDDNLESIMDTIRCIALISKNGGGVGVNITRVRATGSWLRGIPNVSGGVIPWIRIINDTIVAVSQEGKRDGACTVALDVWHYDILEFLESRKEHGDIRRKAHDIQHQVVIPDLFMKRVENDEEWLLVDPYEVRIKFGYELAELWGEEFEKAYEEIGRNESKLRIKKKVKAKWLLKEIMKTQVATGRPYIFFKDTANRYNPLKHDGMIGSGNLCMESFSNFSPSKIIGRVVEGEDDVDISIEYKKLGKAHVCSLLSINLASLEDDELEFVVRSAVRILNNVIDLTNEPIPEAKVHNNNYRVIGIGAMGLADYLARRDIKYESDESIHETDKLFEQIAYYAIDESIELARKYEPFAKYKGSDWDRGIILGRTREQMINSSPYLKEKWNIIYDKLSKYGIRNGQLFAIAPNTSTSLIQGCTASVFPPFSLMFIDKAKFHSAPIFPRYIKDKLWYYTEFKKIDNSKIIDIVSVIQKWVDSGISMELVYDMNNISAKQIYQDIMKAWKKGIKTIYYIRFIQKSVDHCEMCAS